MVDVDARRKGTADARASSARREWIEGVGRWKGWWWWKSSSSLRRTERSVARLPKDGERDGESMGELRTASRTGSKAGIIKTFKIPIFLGQIHDYVLM
jgi:hypothetical protein